MWKTSQDIEAELEGGEENDGDGNDDHDNDNDKIEVCGESGENFNFN